MTILCLASYDKGYDFLWECKRQGVHVVLLTSESLHHKAKFPLDAVDEIFYMPDDDHRWSREHTLNAVSYLARTRVFDRIVPLDDFDVEVAALLREHVRIPGMGVTTAHYFRDKLAMRIKTSEAGIAVPEFVHILHHPSVARFTERIPGPWVLKPRSMAGSLGIKKVHNPDELWRLVEDLGDLQSHYLLERFVPGDIFHVDTIVYERDVLFSVASGYGTPPMQVWYGSGIFTSRVLEPDSEDACNLRTENARVMKALGMYRGVSHTEFIKAHEDGRIYFLETSARVGGAHLSDLVEAATGINLWAEWAKVEIAGGNEQYQVPAARKDYAGLLVSLAHQEHPDTSAYTDPEIVWRMDKDYHVGLIVQSPRAERVKELLGQYTDRVMHDFHA